MKHGYIKKRFIECNEERISKGLKELSYTMFFKHFESDADYNKLVTITPKHGGFRPGSRDGKYTLSIKQIEGMIRAVVEYGHSIDEVTKINGVSRSYLYNHLKKIGYYNK